MSASGDCVARVCNTIGGEAVVPQTSAEVRVWPGAASNSIGVCFPNIEVPEIAALKPNPISSMRQQYHIERRLTLSLRSS